MAHNRQWYSIKNEAGKNPEIFIFDDIDDWWGVSAYPSKNSPFPSINRQKRAGKHGAIAA